jgi:preprotein translocase subunit SecE
MAIAQANDEPKNLSQRALGWPVRVKSYIEELRVEMRRVSWPNRQQVQSTTVVVILSVFAFAAYFFVVDAIVNQTITRLFNTLTKQ